MTTIFTGNLDDGFELGDYTAVKSPEPSRFDSSIHGWNIYQTGVGYPIAWAVTIVEALRFLKAKDDNLRNAHAAGELLRWGLKEKRKARQ